MTTQFSSVRAEIVTEEYSTLNPFTYTQGACSQSYKGIEHVNQSHFLTIRVGLNHNIMVSLQDDPIWFSEGRNCNRKLAALN